MYNILFTASAAKELEELPAIVVKRIFTKIEGLKDNPKPVGSIKLKGKDSLWRIRIGNYRVVYSIIENKLIIEVIRIAHRRKVYKNL